MTKTVLYARLQTAGLDPSLFSACDLARIEALYRADALPPPPSVPVFPPILPLDESSIAPLREALTTAADRCLAQLSAHSLMFSFSAQKLREAFSLLFHEITSALPEWTQCTQQILAAAERDCLTCAAAIEGAQHDLHALACLSAAAMLRDLGDASSYQQALAAHEAAIAAAESALQKADEEAAAIGRWLDRALPALLDTMLPLLEDGEASFSPTACRTAALALRRAVQI